VNGGIRNKDCSFHARMVFWFDWAGGRVVGHKRTSRHFQVDARIVPFAVILAKETDQRQESD
jgi:hypothetical protein